MKNMVGGAKLSMEQIKLRLDTVSELGDVVVTLSPCMSIIKGLSPSLSGIMPEANASMQDLSEILGDVMAGSSVSVNDDLGLGNGNNADQHGNTRRSTKCHCRTNKGINSRRSYKPQEPKSTRQYWSFWLKLISVEKF